jgi:hypothetical protein
MLLRENQTQPEKCAAKCGNPAEAVLGKHPACYSCIARWWRTCEAYQDEHGKMPEADISEAYADKVMRDITAGQP